MEKHMIDQILQAVFEKIKSDPIGTIDTANDIRKITTDLISPLFKKETYKKMFKSIKRLFSTDNSLLIEAIVEDNYDNVVKYLNKGADVNAKTEDGSSALMYSVLSRNPIITKLLLTKKADVNLQTNKGNTALMSAVITNQYRMVKLLLNYDADINIQNDFDETALTLAKKFDNYRIISRLKRKLNIGIPSNKNQFTVLIYCLFFGIFGAHYFYVKKKQIGFIYAFTLGFFGIGVIIDLILIIAGSFTDFEERTINNITHFKNTAKYYIFLSIPILLIVIVITILSSIFKNINITNNYNANEQRQKALILSGKNLNVIQPQMLMLNSEIEYTFNLKFLGLRFDKLYIFIDDENNILFLEIYNPANADKLKEDLKYTISFKPYIVTSKFIIGKLNKIIYLNVSESDDGNFRGYDENNEQINAKIHIETIFINNRTGIIENNNLKNQAKKIIAQRISELGINKIHIINEVNKIQKQERKRQEQESISKQRQRQEEIREKIAEAIKELNLKKQYARNQTGVSELNSFYKINDLEESENTCSLKLIYKGVQGKKMLGMKADRSGYEVTQKHYFGDESGIIILRLTEEQLNSIKLKLGKYYIIEFVVTYKKLSRIEGFVKTIKDYEEVRLNEENQRKMLLECYSQCGNRFKICTKNYTTYSEGCAIEQTHCLNQCEMQYSR